MNRVTGTVLNNIAQGIRTIQIAILFKIRTNFIGVFVQLGRCFGERILYNFALK
jgi:hypothetical protein